MADAAAGVHRGARERGGDAAPFTGGCQPDRCGAYYSRENLKQSEYILSMTIRVASAWLVAFGVVAGSAWAQEAGTDDVQQGHRLAILICANCHIAAKDQPFEPADLSPKCNSAA